MDISCLTLIYLVVLLFFAACGNYKYTNKPFKALNQKQNERKRVDGTMDVFIKIMAVIAAVIAWVIFWCPWF